MKELTRRVSGRILGVAVVGATVVSVGLVSGTSPAAVIPSVSAPLVYDCPASSGTQQIGVSVTAAFPAAVTVGHPIEATAVKVTATLPTGVAADLDKTGAVSVSGSAQLTVAAAQGAMATSAVWPGLAVSSVPIPASGGLVLTASGAVLPMVASVPGDMTFRAGSLSLVLILKKADGSAASPATLRLACAPGNGQGARLAVVRVQGVSASSSVAAQPSSSSGGTAAGGSSPRLSPEAGSPCPGTPIPITFAGSGYLTGWTNVSKLHGSALLGPGLKDNPPAAFLETSLVEYVLPNNINCGFSYQYLTGALNYQGKPQFPPARTTFLAFGFMPTTATMELNLQPIDCRDLTGHIYGRGYECITVSAEVIPPLAYSVTATTLAEVRIYDVKENGVPLNVGPHCQTVTPMNVTLNGNSTAGYNLNTGGPLDGFTTVPRFTGCGVGENLDPLFDSTVSGPGNYVKLTQGALCAQSIFAGTLEPANSECEIPPYTGKTLPNGQYQRTPGHPYGLPYPQSIPTPQR
jgi:hypothetical protein